MVVVRNIILSFVLLSLSFAVITAEASRFSEENKSHPVILVPGFGGSRLLAKLQGKKTEFLCSKNSKEFPLWISFSTVLSFLLSSLSLFSKCVEENMSLVYNNVNRTTSNVQGVSLRVADFGHPSSVETLHPDSFVYWLYDGIYDYVKHLHTKLSTYFLKYLPEVEYFQRISTALQSIGFKRDVSIKGAPYDFRKAPNEHKDWFIMLKTLVEETYHTNGNNQVVLIAHSMGGPMTLVFLRQQTQEWKDKYIKSLISLSASWGGSLKAMKVFIEGDDLGYPILFSTEELGSVLKTMPSMAWMMPFQGFWGKDDVLVSTQTRNYTVYDMKDFFHDLQQPMAWEMYKDVLNYTTDIEPPGVEVHCLHGSEVETLHKLRYDGDLGQNPNYEQGPGDGTVNLRSLKGCLKWSKMQKQKVHPSPDEFAHLDHMGILEDEKVVKYIEKVVRGEK